MDKQPLGIINVMESFSCAYRESFVCLGLLNKPPETDLLRQQGVGITNLLNQGVRYMLHYDTVQWLWMVHDNCVYPETILMNLLEHDVDIVVPYCLSGVYPHLPLFFNKSDYSVAHDVAEQSGLVETDQVLATYSGMLVKRHVFETLDDPWFINGVTKQGCLGGDLYFCEQALAHGFKIHIDFNNPIGSIMNYSVWAERHSDGAWRSGVHKAIPWEEDDE